MEGADGCVVGESADRWCWVGEVLVGEDAAEVDEAEAEEADWEVDAATSLTSIGVSVIGDVRIISSFFRPAFLVVVPEDSFALIGGVWLVFAKKDTLRVTMLKGRNKMKGW